MRILVVSDTHGILTTFREVVRRVEPDEVWHCGDVERDLDSLKAIANVPVRVVRGNMDDDRSIPFEEIFEFRGNRILMVHGHKYMVNYSLDYLREYAAKNDCNVILYGHTHCPELIQEPGLTILNPGSLTAPRQYGHKKTYAVITDGSDGTLMYSQCEV